MRFWLDRGVDGFRVDVIWHLIKDERMRDNPVNPDYVEGSDPPSRRLVPAYSADQPEIHDVVADMRAVVDEYDDRVMIGEIYLPIDRLVTYYGGDRPAAHLPFNFHLILTAWDAREIELVIDTYEGALPDGAWPNWVLGNHDQPRVASRIGDGQARVAAVLLLTLRGTPTIYYGEELGLRDVPIPADRAHDVREANQPGRGLGRDPVRTPMPWTSDDPGGGFSSGRPWLPLGDENRSRSVAAQRDDPASMLSLYRRLIELRRREPALAIGSYRPVPADGSVLAYRRRHGERELLVALNLADRPAKLRLPPEVPGGRVLLAASGREYGPVVDGMLALDGDEALVLEPHAER
jgi:alpha-glucosidase